MGYTTEFDGRIAIVPPLSEKEIEYINAFSDTRRMDREKGPYYVGDNTNGMNVEADVRDPNRPPEGQPGLWCNWEVVEDGNFIEWNGAEKFYDAELWMQYIIDHFICEDPIARRENSHFVFLGEHMCNGEILAEGEEQGDVWKLVVRNNVVSVKKPTISWD
jgi:hypothetical protein